MAVSVRVPKYRLHKPTGQAVVTLAGRDRYLGRHGTERSKEAYRRLLAEHLAGRLETGSEDPSITCRDFAARYQRFAEGYYVKDGAQTSEVPGIRAAFTHVVSLYGSSALVDFDVAGLRLVRESMINAGYSRGVVNQSTGRIVRAFRWATAEQLYPGTKLAELTALPGLRAGRTAARECPPVEPVDDAIVTATLTELPEPVGDMVRLQRVTGMRPGEVCLVRPCDIDRSGATWVYRPESHKTQHHGKVRRVLIGPRGQSLLRPYLDRPADEYCFRSSIATRVPRKRRRYRRDTYRTAIARACERAFPIPDGLSDIEKAAFRRRHWWSPNRLRHSFATDVRREYGLEAAQVLLGHSQANVTQVYAERDLTKGESVAQRIG